MLKCDIQHGRKCYVELHGDLSMICSDLANLISGIDNSLKEKNPDIAETFEKMFVIGLLDGRYFGKSKEEMDEMIDECHFLHSVAETAGNVEEDDDADESNTDDDIKKAIRDIVRSIAEKALSDMNKPKEDKDNAAE